MTELSSAIGLFLVCQSKQRTDVHNELTYCCQ